MNKLRSVVVLAVLFWLTFKLFEVVAKLRPPGEEWDVAYFVGAATIDWLMYRATPHLIAGKLCRDVELLCIASMFTHAIGFALYMVWYPPYFHNWTIKAINYVLAFKLITTGGGNAFNNTDWRGLLRGVVLRRQSYMAQKAEK